MDNAFDIIVVGGGMAGISVGALLAKSRKVAVIERESQPGFHATGRSAALFTEVYGSEAVRALTRASRAFLFEPAPTFADHPLIRRRGAMFIARADQLEQMEKSASQPDVKNAFKTLSPAEAVAKCPILRPGYAAGALLEPDASDIDVHELNQGYLRLLRSLGGRLITDSEIIKFDRAAHDWVVITATGNYRAPIVINAAGAWADQIAQLAGQPTVGLQPKRRTALLVDAPPGHDSGDWPFVVDADEQFYFKPDAGALLLSPADETPSDPCDAQPDEMDVAIAVERVEQATTLSIRRVRHKWAGLRTFTHDRNPVVGFSSAENNFFWLAGQGGFGIQTAPALARLAANWVDGLETPSDLLESGLRIESLLPNADLRASLDPTQDGDAVASRIHEAAAPAREVRRAIGH